MATGAPQAWDSNAGNDWTNQFRLKMSESLKAKEVEIRTEGEAMVGTTNANLNNALKQIQQHIDGANQTYTRNLQDRVTTRDKIVAQIIGEKSRFAEVYQQAIKDIVESVEQAHGDVVRPQNTKSVVASRKRSIEQDQHGKYKQAK